MSCFNFGKLQNTFKSIIKRKKSSKRARYLKYHYCNQMARFLGRKFQLIKKSFMKNRKFEKITIWKCESFNDRIVRIWSFNFNGLFELQLCHTRARWHCGGRSRALFCALLMCCVIYFTSHFYLIKATRAINKVRKKNIILPLVRVALYRVGLRQMFQL